MAEVGCASSVSSLTEGHHQSRMTRGEGRAGDRCHLVEDGVVDGGHHHAVEHQRKAAAVKERVDLDFNVLFCKAGGGSAAWQLHGKFCASYPPR